MVLEIPRLPEIPGGNEDFASRFEVLFDLLENHELVLFGRQVMENSDREDVVVGGEVFPGGVLGDIGLNKFSVWICFLGFLEKFLTDIQSGVPSVLGKSEKKTAVAATYVQNR
jgi:hypothetical protein